MKKLSALGLSTVTFLTLAPYQVFAKTGDIVITPCAQDAGGGFGVLCNFGVNGISGLVSALITLLFVASVLIALGFLIYGGIKWITSGGDKGKVEAARGTIVAALVGLVLVFLSYFIINIVGQFFGLDLLDGTLTIPSIGN